MGSYLFECGPFAWRLLAQGHGPDLQDAALASH